MKQFIDLPQQQLTTSETHFITLWKTRKNYDDYTRLSVGECIELLIATTYNLHYDYSDARFFNFILTNNESLIAWDGSELIDILFYELRLAIKKRLNNPNLL